LHYAFHCERAEGRVLVADLFLRIASDVPPRLDFVHVLKLEVRWGLASYRKGLIEPASDVFAPIVIDGLLRHWEEVFFVTVLAAIASISMRHGATLRDDYRDAEIESRRSNTRPSRGPPCFNESEATGGGTLHLAFRLAGLFRRLLGEAG
jgi:hypothetical protein